MTIALFDIHDSERIGAASALRLRVFVEEQRVPADEEIDEHDLTDEAAVHALALDGDGRAIGTGRFYVKDATTVQIGRMAVDAERRGAGVGRRILAALLAEASRRGFRRARLHAQVHARAFYLRAGFVEDGEPLWDGGLEHVPMAAYLPVPPFLPHA